MPDLRDYFEARKLLVDVLQWRKKADPKFSISEWSRELGLKSRTYLHLVIAGKRKITPNTAGALAVNLGLSKSDISYFETLISYSQAPSMALKETYAQRLFEFRSGRRQRVDISNHFRLVASLLGPRIQVLLTLSSAPKTAAGLADLLGVEENAVESMLHTLEDLTLARKVPPLNGNLEAWEATTQEIRVKDHLGDLALQAFHRKSLTEAIHAIDLPPQQRRYKSLVLPLSEADYGTCLASISEFAQQILSRYAHPGNLPANTRLYQINISTIPISKPILHSDRFQSDPVGEPKHQASPGDPKEPI
jgi:uncharacterized protein (TIGR02147 family)